MWIKLWISCVKTITYPQLLFFCVDKQRADEFLCIDMYL